MKKKMQPNDPRRVPYDLPKVEIAHCARLPIPKHSTLEEFKDFRDNGMTCIVEDNSEETMNQRAMFFLEQMKWVKEKAGEELGNRVLDDRQSSCANGRKGGNARSAPLSEKVESYYYEWKRKAPKMSDREIAKKLESGERATGVKVTPGTYGRFEAIRATIKRVKKK